MSDEHNMHIIADPSNIGRWVAVRLSDGGSDGIVYDYRREAIRHQLHETMCAYVKLHPAGMSAKEAEGILRFHRFAYDNGMRLTDPEGPEVILPSTNEDMSSQLRRLRKGLN
jgi:hypothetical protein